MIRAIKEPIHPDYHKYPSSDGEPMAVSTLHFEWMVTIKENLEILTENQDTFVAGDLLWYPVEGKANICKAPDVMVAIGRPKGQRLSYLQWHEGGIAPQVVFEVFSKSNRRGKNKEELQGFYAKYGVEEYYSFDPGTKEFIIRTRKNGGFNQLGGVPRWVSPLLGVHFECRESSFRIFHPDGKPFLSFEELARKNRYLQMEYDEVRQLREKERQYLLGEIKRADLAEANWEKAKEERDKAKAERDKLKNEKDKESEKRKLFEQKLREMGIDPNSL